MHFLWSFALQKYNLEAPAACDHCTLWPFLRVWLGIPGLYFFRVHILIEYITALLCSICCLLIYFFFHFREEMASPQRFLGNSMVIWSNLALVITLPWHIGLMFRTRQGNGVLLHATAGQHSTITLLVSAKAGAEFHCHSIDERPGEDIVHQQAKRDSCWRGSGSASLQ